MFFVKLKKAQASVQEFQHVSRAPFIGFRFLNTIFCPVFPSLNSDNNLSSQQNFEVLLKLPYHML